jgi:hypothetical protein
MLTQKFWLLKIKYTIGEIVVGSHLNMLTHEQYRVQPRRLHDTRW